MAPSTKPVAQKLGMKADHRAILVGAPKGFEKSLGKLPAGLSLQKRLSGEFDFITAFFESQKELAGALPRLRKGLRKSGMLWICWRKGGVTDLSRDTIWPLAEKHGLDGVSSVAIDEKWSALKLMYPKAQRKDA
jgi:hypothetical protein